jgi:hypothetical protein
MTAPYCTVVSSPIVATAVPVAFTAVLSTKYLQWSREMSSNNKYYFVLDLWKRQCQIQYFEVNKNVTSPSAASPEMYGTMSDKQR